MKSGWLYWMYLLLICALLLPLTGCGGDDAVVDGDQDPEVVTCQLDTDCATDEYCNAQGICTIQGNLPECTVNSDCETGKICSALGTCIVDPQPDGDSVDGDYIDGDLQDGVIISGPETVAFGSVQIGEETSRNVELTNRGVENLVIRALDLPTGNPDFVINGMDDLPLTLVPGMPKTFSVTFSPTRPYEANEPLQIASNADNEPLLTVMLTSELKGTSVLRADPEEVQFGNVRVGDMALTETLQLCNDGDGNKPITVTGIVLVRSTPHFDFDMNIDAPSPNAPYYIVPGTCLPVELTYEPTEETVWPEIHENQLRVHHDAQVDPDGEDDGRTEIEMTGAASESSLYVEPNPIDLGTVNIEENRAVQVSVTNESGRDLNIQNILLSGNHCEEFELALIDIDNFPYEFPLGTTISTIGVEYSPTNTGLDEGCYFLIETDQEGPSRFSKTPVTGRGREANKAPIARISREANGAELLLPIDVMENASSQAKRITLYGDISYDPDENYPLTYKWTLDKPDVSLTEIWPNDESPIISMDVDWAGPYTVTLVVTDSDGLESDPKQVLINVVGDEKIVIDMTFTGSGDMNVNLAWRAPNGAICSDTSMSSNRTCNMGDYGFAYVSNHTSAFSNGNKETITHSNAGNGAYTISVLFTEDCASWDMGLFCLDEKNTDVTISIRVDNDIQPRWTRTVHLTETGQSMEWFINKVSGQWGEPNP